MSDIKYNKEQLLNAHQGVAVDTREALKFLMQSLANATDDEERFFENVAKSDKAALVLQRINSALSKLIAIERKLLRQRLALENKGIKERSITRQDCELVISLVRGWGLLRDGSDEAVEKIIDNYENHIGDY